MLIKLIKLISAVCTIVASFFAIFIGIPQIKIANKQLQDLNSTAKINVVFKQLSNIQIGPTVSEQINISINPTNTGNYTTSHWRLGIIFCKDITVSRDDKKWKKIDDIINSNYVYESDKLLMPHSTIFSTDVLDSAGIFGFYVPSERFSNTDLNIPIAIVVSSGEKTRTNLELISLRNNGYNSQNVGSFSKDGLILSSEEADQVSKCRNIVSPK